MITSTSNAKVKQLLNLQKKRRLRDSEGVFIMEGPRIFAEISKEHILEVYVSEDLYLREKEQWDISEHHTEVLANHVFAHVSDTQTPQGLLCIVKKPHYTIQEMLKGDATHLLILDNLQDPGNLGTIMRTAVGAGVTGIILSKGCVDIYNPKTIRAAMGVLYRIPFVYAEDLQEEIALLQKNKVTLYAAHLQGEHIYDKIDYRKKTAFLIGNEGNGLRPEIAAQADVWVKIPMLGQLESLNAAVASAVLMFEVCRQRR